MPTARKVATLAELQDLVERSAVTISTNYRGLRVSEITALRRRMRALGVEMKVIKNTLLRMAAERAGKPDLVKIVVGPTALIFGFGDPNEPANAITEYIRTTRSVMTVTGAFFEGQVLPASGVAELASLPSRPQLLAQFMGDIQSPVATLAGLLSGTLREFAGLIEARSNQLEGEPA